MVYLVVFFAILAAIGFCGGAIVWTRHLGLTGRPPAAQLPASTRTEPDEPSPAKPVCQKCRWSTLGYFCANPSNVPEAKFTKANEPQSKFNSHGQCRHWRGGWWL